MCNLLEYKGYRIPILNDKDVPNLDPEFNLKTEEQLEEEDRKNQGTKLEELIRKGTPAALAEANDMMKIMSGYDKSKKPDYKVQVSSELERIESKAILLNDLLNNMSAADMRNQRDSTLSDLHLSTTLAQQKLQKFIEENDDEDRMSQLLELNDLIITVLKKYENISQGASVEKNSLDRVVVDIEKTNAKRGASIPNLIDFDVVEDAPVSNPISFDLFSSLQQQNNLFNTAAQTGFQQPHFPSAIGGDAFKSTPINPLISGLGIQSKGSNSSMSSPSNFAIQNAIGPMPTNSKSNSSNDPFANIDIFSSNAGELKPAVGMVPPLVKQSKIVECIYHIN